MQTFTPLQYLKIDIASAFGHDKWTWNERIAWFDQHADHMGELVHKAKEPAMFYAGCKAYMDAMNKVPSGYMISLDATSSGLQLLSALTGCRKSAELCNVIPYFGEEVEAQRRDGYTVIYRTMTDKIGEEGKIERDGVKEAIMTALYSSRAVPKRVFGEGALLDIFYDTMAEMAPAAWELNEAMLTFWNKDALSHDWVLPDNFHVHVKVMDSVKETVHFLNQPFDTFRKANQPMAEGRSLGANTIHSIDGMIVREMTRRCDYDMDQVNRIYDLLSGDMLIGGTKDENSHHAQMVKTLWAHYEASGYLSARIIDHLFPCTIHLVDPAVIHELLESLPDKPFKVISIHDCFRCHPNYGNDMRWQYANQLKLIAKSEMLSYLISQLIGKTVQVGKVDPEMWKDILDTDYALS
ncbi:DNA-directed RNA polymerase [Aquabacterium sp.]|uniref:DNA-directed RNA polymerase n=1 Tax=Aquabacterium sp. TaxID=1872578 RepID=UPI0025C24999|nr:DNA-directed RNA polymerase [Aquabacterium sp.]